jgi:thiol-disulfide isomerase/thioredoxin
VQELGSHLSVRNTHGYAAWDTMERTESVLKGRMVIGLYFSEDWCPPCQAFNPLLKHFHSSKRAHCDKKSGNILPFKVVLVSRCIDARATKHYFSAMPWTAMTHDEASGKKSLDLLNKFGIPTIPALVLLDGEGAVLCQDAHERLREDPTGQHFPWQDPPAGLRLPQVGFDLVDNSRPDVARLSTPLPRPSGRPLQFATVRPSSIQDSQNKKEAAIAHGDRGSSHRLQMLGALLAKKPGKTATVVPTEGRIDSSRACRDRVPDTGRAKKTVTHPVVNPQPAPTTLQPTSTSSKQKTEASNE